MFTDEKNDLDVEGSEEALEVAELEPEDLEEVAGGAGDNNGCPCPTTLNEIC